MGKAERFWRRHDGAENMVSEIILKYPKKFAHIAGTSIVGCFAIEPKKSKTGAMEDSVRWENQRYQITFYAETWDKYTPTQRATMLFRCLRRIPRTIDGRLVSDRVSLRETE
ncbi:MAG TPA: putative metallopeptidase [Planctomycetota bacterium]|jgi:hypothetical protein